MREFFKIQIIDYTSSEIKNLDEDILSLQKLTHNKEIEDKIIQLTNQKKNLKGKLKYLTGL